MNGGPVSLLGVSNFYSPSISNENGQNDNDKVKPKISFPKPSTNTQNPDSLKSKSAKNLNETNSEEPNQSQGSLLYSSFRIQRAKYEVLKTEFNQVHQQLTKTPDDYQSRVNGVKVSLKMACASATASVAEGYIRYASDCALVIKKKDYFDGVGHYLDYSIALFKGVDVKDMPAVREAFLKIHRAFELTPKNPIIEKDYNNFLEQVKSKLQGLEKEKKIREEDIMGLQQDFEMILKEDPFKEEFKKNPQLFKLIKNAPEDLLKKRPHLESIDAFLSRYPEAANIGLPNDTYTLENLKSCISQTKNNPLLRNIHLVSPEPFLTPFAANLLKDLMLEFQQKKNVSIVFGNQEDGKTLTKAFISDSSLKIEQDSLKVALAKSNEYEGKVYRYFIDSKHPIKKI